MPDVGAEKNDSGYYYPNDRATLVYNENNGTNEPSTINTSDLNTSLGDANEEFMRQEELRKNEEASRQNALQKYQDAHIQAARENTELQMLNAALTAEPAATPDETDRNPQISQQVVRLFIGGQDKGDVPAQISYIPQYNFNFDMYTPEKSQLDLAVDQIRSGAATVSELLDVRKYMLPLAALTVMNSDVLTAGLLDKFKSTKAADKRLSTVGKEVAGGGLNFTQTTASARFSEAGTFSGKTIGEVANDLRTGVLKATDMPVEYIERDGVKLIVNTRSSLALRRAGIPESEWNLVNKTGDAFTETKITERLARNELTEEGIDAVRITGSGKNASNLE